jgi:hypothetical protein
MLAGIYLCLSGKSKGLLHATPAQIAAMGMLVVLLAFNAAEVIALVLRVPVYNSMKGSYLLASTPALMAFLSLGIMRVENLKLLKRGIALVFAAIFTLATVHILHIAISLHAIISGLS